MSSSKSFADIHDDYAFFVAHATEAAADRDACLPHLLELAGDGRNCLHLMDFGSGPGEFSAALLTTAGLPASALRITVVEPDTVYREEAAQRLAAYTDSPVRAYASLPDDGPEDVDLLIANHSLYYVSDLAACTAAITRSLAPGGRLVAAIAHRENAMIRIWQAAFASIDLAIPHHIAEDVADCLTAAGHAPEAVAVAYRLDFPDSAENRLRILRFLLADYLPRLDQDDLLAWFDRYATDGRVQLDTTHRHLIVRKPLHKDVYNHG